MSASIFKTGDKVLYSDSFLARMEKEYPGLFLRPSPIGTVVGIITNLGCEGYPVVRFPGERTEPFQPEDLSLLVS